MILIQIMGPAAAGKTTIANEIKRFLDQSGRRYLSICADLTAEEINRMIDRAKPDVAIVQHLTCGEPPPVGHDWIIL